MKFLVLFSFLFLMAGGLYAQDTIPEPVKPERKKIKELGINATGLLTNYLSFNSDLVDPGAYVLTYKIIKPSGRGFRVGFGISLNSLENKESFLNLRIGYEKQNNITPKWIYYWGFDLVANVGNFTESISEASKGVGLGPIIGLQYRINDKIGLSTESSFYFLSKEAGEFQFKTALPSFIVFTINL